MLGVVLVGLGDNAVESRHASDEEDGCDRRRPEDWYKGWLSGVGEARNTSAMVGDGLSMDGKVRNVLARSLARLRGPHGYRMAVGMCIPVVPSTSCDSRSCLCTYQVAGDASDASVPLV